MTHACMPTQVLDTYFPGAIFTGEVSLLDFRSITNAEDGGCNADMVIYNPAVTYFCSDLWFLEEGTDSLLANDAAYLPFHTQTRDVVRELLRTRGFRHTF